MAEVIAILALVATGLILACTPTFISYVKKKREDRFANLTPYFGTRYPTVGQALYLYPKLKTCLESVGYSSDKLNVHISKAHHGYLIINIKKLKNEI